MTRLTPVKIDNLRDRQAFVLQTEEEITRYRRFLVDDDHPVFINSVKYVQVKVGSQIQTQVVMEPRERTLDEIAARTGDFAQLDIVQLRELAKIHGITITGKDVSTTCDDRPHLIEALQGRIARGKTAAPATGSTVAASTKPSQKSNPPIAIIPADIQAMSDKDMESEAGMLELPIKQWRRWDRQKRETELAKARGRVAEAESAAGDEGGGGE